MKRRLKNQLLEAEKFVSDVNTFWENIVNSSIATESELQLITDINGYTIETLNDVLYARTGYHTWDQYINEDNSEDDLMEGIYNKFCDWVDEIIKSESVNWDNSVEGKKAFNYFLINATDIFEENFEVWCEENNYDEDRARGELGDSFDDVINEKLQEEKDKIYK